MKYIRLILLGLCCILALSGCGFWESEEDGDNVVYVYNWGDYVDPDTLKQFEEETGIRQTWTDHAFVTADDALRGIGFHIGHDQKARAQTSFGIG